MRNATVLLAAVLFSAAGAHAQSSTVIFEDSFESGTLDPTYWTARPSLEGADGGLIEAVVSADAPDGGVYVRIGRASDGELTTNALDLQLDLSGHDQVELRYYLLDYHDEAHAGEGIYLSDDGGVTFTDEPVLPLDLNEDSANDVFLTPPPVDIDKLAAAYGLDLSSTFVIRFQQIGTSDFVWSGYDGFMLDAVSVTVPEIEYVKVTPDAPFTDSFEDGTLGPMWQEAYASDADQGGVTAPLFAPTRLGGRVDVVTSEDAPDGAFYVLMGRSTDGELTTSALDLRLDLSALSQAELRYTILNHYDETHVQEGLYFSDDGGASFVQVREYDVGEEAANIFLTPPPVDINALAAAHGLTLSSEFVIRFQQIGASDFSWSGEDGFILDAVSVTAPEIVYAGLDTAAGGDFVFEDSFESGTFGPMWQEATPSEPASGVPTAPAFAPTRLGSRVEVVSSQNADDGSFHALIGRWGDAPSSSTLTTSALDLRLNLEGTSEVELQFALWDDSDETHVQEGLYFSDDGGATFTDDPVFTFDTSNRPNEYANETVDIDALAAAHGLTLSSEFVIRFQQIGASDFSWSGEDGFILDNVRVIGDVETAEITPLSTEDGALPEGFALGANYPNPFNPGTAFAFTLPAPQHVRVTLHDALGRQLRTFVDAVRTAGEHTVRADLGHLPSGVYFYRMEAGGFSQTRRMLLVK